MRGSRRSTVAWLPTSRVENRSIEKRAVVDDETMHALDSTERRGEGEGKGGESEGKRERDGEGEGAGQARGGGEGGKGRRRAGEAESADAGVGTGEGEGEGEEKTPHPTAKWLIRFEVLPEDAFSLVTKAPKRARPTSEAEPIAKPLPMAAVVLPAASSASVFWRTCGPPG